ncbi:hypothetical protein I7I51_08340 [Histoplasma capsulatum]|uniref:Cation-transporting ATPase n=1 Tax=Ajellomyces capsulatus TaxID=5037 RepID=A0A8A1M0F7_AJECA|nr:hypothetical protein I7I51_08340 [Histoplasma capsulatum]
MPFHPFKQQQTASHSADRSLASRPEDAHYICCQHRVKLSAQGMPSVPFVVGSSSCNSLKTHLKSSKYILAVLGAGPPLGPTLMGWLLEYSQCSAIKYTRRILRGPSSEIMKGGEGRTQQSALPLAGLSRKLGMLTVCRNTDGLFPCAEQPEPSPIYLQVDFFTIKCSSEAAHILAKMIMIQQWWPSPFRALVLSPIQISLHLKSQRSHFLADPSVHLCSAHYDMPGEAMLPAEVKRVDHCLQQADRDSDKHDHMDWVLAAEVSLVNPGRESAQKVGGLDEGNWWFGGDIKIHGYYVQLQSINNCEPFISSREILSLTLPLALLPRCILSWDLVCVYQLYLPDLASKASTGIMPRLVDNSQIQSASLHNPLPLQLHAYVWPFLIIWPTFLAVYLSPERYDTYIQGSEWTFLWAGGIFTLQALVWLSTKWNVNVQALFTTSTAKSVYSAKLIKVSPVVNAGSAEICPLLREKYAGKDDISFLFQKRRFLYYPDRNTFAPLSYAIDTEPKPLLKTFQHSQGLKTDKEIGENQNHYGDNTFDIPVPTFTELFKEHAVAPFFVFQVFCVGLWLLDEYWYYSLFTLLMLVTFESTVVWQRQRTLNEFRGMSIKPYEVWVYRKNAWTEIKSDKLLPGDVLSVNRTREDSGVACDILMIEGSVIVNEAMLSGESTPLLKDSIQLRPEDDQLDPEGLDKNSFLYGGTKVLQITHPNSAASPPNGIPTPPDNGALGVVVKTGFETSQGSLVRTMIYSTERVSANNVEALLFILFLLTFAIAASCLQFSVPNHSESPTLDGLILRALIKLEP